MLACSTDPFCETENMRGDRRESRLPHSMWPLTGGHEVCPRWKPDSTINLALTGLLVAFALAAIVMAGL